MHIKLKLRGIMQIVYVYVTVYIIVDSSMHMRHVNRHTATHMRHAHTGGKESKETKHEPKERKTEENQMNEKRRSR